MLRPTPGALRSNRLEERPAAIPAALYVHGGRRPSQFSVVVFEPDGPRLHSLQAPSDLKEHIRSDHPLWVRVMGLSDPLLITAMLDPLGVPRILLPPLLEVPQRPRADSLGDALLVVMHHFSVSHDPAHLISSQVGALLKPGLLVSFEEAPAGEAFPELTDWLLSLRGGVELPDLDNILHFVVDETLDEIFPILEQIANRLSSLEEAALRDPKPKLLARTFQHRSNLLTIRGQIWPLRHQIRVLLRQRQDLLGREAILGFRDMGELVDLLFENCELLRHQCDAITQSYAASVANRMNQVMKTLTILTSVFAPLTFIVGVYGMNFENMPELKWHYGYAYAMGLMALIALIQMYWLWRRNWFQDWTSIR